jgi:hypothetical protein
MQVGVYFSTENYRIRVRDCDDTDPNNDKNNPNSKCFVDPKDDPCANKDLRNKKVSSNAQNLINQRIHNILNAPGTRIDTYEFGVQDMETDGVGDINLDNYSLKINQLPNGYSPQQLFEEIRTNFDELVTGGDFFWEKTTFMPYDSQDASSWNSSNPLGSAMDFQTPFDTATVIATEYSYDEMYWTFTTVTSFDHWGHPVSGHRQFGLEDNGDGSYSFVVRGADRLHTLFDLGANATLPSPGEGKDFAFDLADRTWKNLMESIEKFVKNKPGSDVEHFDKSKNDYAKRHEYNKDDCPE